MEQRLKKGSPKMNNDELVKLQISVLLARFTACRSEIDHRSNRQLALITLNATAIAAIGSFIFSKDVGTKPLLLVPIVCPAFGLAFLDHYLSIRRIGSFVQNVLNRKMHVLTGADLPDYEAYAHPFPSRRILRLLILILPLLMMFFVIPAGSLFVALNSSSEATRDLAFWGGCILGIIMLALFLCLWFPVALRSPMLDSITNVPTPPELKQAAADGSPEAPQS
jgi:hypothetical protein